MICVNQRCFADHNCVHLLPAYKTVLKKEKTQIKEVKVCSDESVLSVQEYFHCTDWEMFQQSTGDLDELPDVTCSYATFCRDTIVSSKRVKIHPNNRPWVTKSVKSCRKKKKCAFKKEGRIRSAFSHQGT